MMKIVPALVLCLGSWVRPGISLSNPVVLDFEGLAAMDYWAGSPIPGTARLSDGYLNAYGVRFNSGSTYVAVVNLGPGHATSGVNGIGGSTPSGILTYSRQFPIRISFFSPSDPQVEGETDFVQVRGDLQGFPSQTILLNAYDRYGSLLATTSVLDTGGATLTLAHPGIHAVEFLGSPGDDFGVALDDLSFNPVVSVPTAVAPFSWGQVKAGWIK
jgi:hypothetical protein